MDISEPMLDPKNNSTASCPPRGGSVARTVGTTVSAAGFPAPVGAVANPARVGRAALAEVVGFRDDLTVLYPLSDLHGVRRGNRVRLVRTTRGSRGPGLLGRVIDAKATRSTASRNRPWATAPRSIAPARSLHPAAHRRAAGHRASARSTAC